jgi:preprotein translocase subunit SecD
MSKVKQIFKSWQVWLVLILLIFSVVVIQPKIFGNDGVTIRSVKTGSPAELAGISKPDQGGMPLSREKVIALNGQIIKDVNDYYQETNKFVANRTIYLTTNKGEYQLTLTNTTDLGISVYDAPTSNLRYGLDLAGGTRVLLQPESEVDNDQLDVIISNLEERLNVYGLSDIVVKSSQDLEGDKYILVEIAGSTQEEVRELLSKQGKFEAMIGNETIFIGGQKDITHVCRSADCSGINPMRGCSRTSDGYVCPFYFEIALSEEAAKRQAEATEKLSVISSEGGSYLSEDLILFLDDLEVDSLRISADLKGRATTNIQITGSGAGVTESDAILSSLENMKKLQSVLITGSLPVKLNVVKMDAISASLGEEYLNNIILVGLMAIISVSLIAFLRYRKIKIVLPMVITIIVEIFLILGISAAFSRNLDLASLASIIIIAGTGIDHLIIISDETTGKNEEHDWKRKLKNAMFIVFGAFFTTCAGMFPLIFAGAGLLKGFAITTIIGLIIGVLIARPAYAKVIEILSNES